MLLCAGRAEEWDIWGPWRQDWCTSGNSVSAKSCYGCHLFTHFYKWLQEKQVQLKTKHFTTGGSESIPAKEERGGKKEKVMKNPIWNQLNWFKKLPLQIQFLNIATGHFFQILWMSSSSSSTGEDRTYQWHSCSCTRRWWTSDSHSADWETALGADST